MAAGEDPESLQRMALSEFSALRSEIGSRSTAQHTLINLSITAIGAVVGFALAQKGDLWLLLLLPILSPSLDMLYLDHAINIMNIGNYINNQLKPTLRLMRYEEVVRSHERRRLLRVLPYGLPIFIIFAGVPIGSLIVTLSVLLKEPETEMWMLGMWTLWSIGLILVLVYLSFWLYFMVLPYWAQSNPRESSVCCLPLLLAVFRSLTTLVSI
jgi:hypothetical protein